MKTPTERPKPPSPRSKHAASQSPRQRSRLSLKSTKGQPASTAQRRISTMFLGPVAPQEGNQASGDAEEGEKSLAADLSGAVSAAKPPCVAALHNLGNTCFLNSVLQVLRYTPGFVAEIGGLTAQIRQTLKDKSSEENSEEDYDEENEEVQTWTMVQHLHELFRRMSGREDSYAAGATQYIAIRPYDVLHMLEKLNPMFEGGMQQDTHELLHCLLAYIQDACKELNAFRKKLSLSCRSEANAVFEEQDKENLMEHEENKEINLESGTIPQLDGTVDETEVEKPTRRSKSKVKLSCRGKKAVNGEAATENVAVNGDERMDGATGDKKDGSQEIPKKRNRSRKAMAHINGNDSTDVTENDIKEDEDNSAESKDTGRKRKLSNKSRSNKTVPVENEKKTEDAEEPKGSLKNFFSSVRGKDCQTLKPELGAKSPKKQQNMESNKSSRSPEIPAEKAEVAETVLEKLNNEDKTKMKDRNQGGKMVQEKTDAVMKPAKDRTEEESKLDQKKEMKTRKGSQSRSRKRKSCSASEELESEVTRNDKGQRSRSVSNSRAKSTEGDSEKNTKTSKKRKVDDEKKDSDKNGAINKSPKEEEAGKNKADTDPSIKVAVKPKDGDIKAMFQRQTVKRLGMRGKMSVQPIQKSSNTTKEPVNIPQTSERDEHSEASVVTEKTLKPTGVETDYITADDKGKCELPGQPNNIPVSTELEEETKPLKAEVRPILPKSSTHVGMKQTARKTLSFNFLKQEALNRKAVVKMEQCQTTDGQLKAASASLATQAVEDPVDKMFQGSMALRTKCLECESCTERKQEYQAIGVPIKKPPCRSSGDCNNSDNEDDGESDPSSWVLSAIHEVEHLREENKYRCDRCLRLVEAQRSVNYLTIPPVLTLHQIRFASFAGLLGGLSKISEYKPTPRVMPCLLDKCQPHCSQSSHRFSLYAVITHTGISLSSGHYTAYVKAPPGGPKGYQSPRAMIGPTEPEPANQSSANSNPANENGSGDSEMADPNNNADDNNNCEANQESRENVPDKAPEAEMKEEVGELWYECDDDIVTVLTDTEMEKVLSPAGLSTPYLLFYKPMTDIAG